MGGIPIWSYGGTGVYLCTLVNAFPQNRCSLTVGTPRTFTVNDGRAIQFMRSNTNNTEDDFIILSTRDLQNNLIDNSLMETLIKIEVYN